MKRHKILHYFVRILFLQYIIYGQNQVLFQRLLVLQRIPVRSLACILLLSYQELLALLEPLSIQGMSFLLSQQ